MPPLPQSHPMEVRYCAIVASLARLADIRSLPLPALHLVMALRLCALMEQAGRNPVAELVTRFHSVTAAKAALGLAEAVSRCWPERYMVARPCALKMTPDEATLAAMARSALARDRAGFEQALHGFVRSDRHDVLFAATVEAVAALQSAS
jgi:hypothetical protein